MGQLITILTIRMALLLMALALIGWALRLRSTRVGGWLKWSWALGFAFFVAHVVAAFQFYHGWSHQAALADTARQTGEMLGWRFGEGIYFSYLFLVLWGIDVFLRLRSSPDRRPNWMIVLWLAYMVFIAFNGAAVFEAGPTRWGAWITLVILLTIAIVRLAASIGCMLRRPNLHPTHLPAYQYEYQPEHPLPIDQRGVHHEDQSIAGSCS